MLNEDRCAQRDLTDELESAARSDVQSYEATRLHERSEFAWGVVCMPSGALAEDENGDLLFRMTEEEARAAASDMSAELHEQKSAASRASSELWRSYRMRVAS